MAQFAGLLPRLDPYGQSFNAERARRVSMGRRVLAAPTTTEGLSILVLHKDKPELLRRLWFGFTKLRERCEGLGISVELLLGDTGSTDQATIELLNAPPVGVDVVRGMSYQFSRCNNDLFERSRHQIVLFMNNDVFIDERPEGVIEVYEAIRAQTDLGAVSAVLLFEDGSVQHAGVELLRTPDLYAVPWHPGTGKPSPYVLGDVIASTAATGAFLCTPSALFARSGGFDERYATECQDIDYCLRLRRAGYGIQTIDVGPIYHVENGTRELGEENWADRALFVRRWSSFAECL